MERLKEWALLALSKAWRKSTILAMTWASRGLGWRIMARNPSRLRRQTRDAGGIWGVCADRRSPSDLGPLTRRPTDLLYANAQRPNSAEWPACLACRALLLTLIGSRAHGRIRQFTCGAPSERKITAS